MADPLRRGEARLFAHLTAVTWLVEELLTRELTRTPAAQRASAARGFIERFETARHEPSDPIGREDAHTLTQLALGSLEDMVAAARSRTPAEKPSAWRGLFRRA